MERLSNRFILDPIKCLVDKLSQSQVIDSYRLNKDMDRLFGLFSKYRRTLRFVGGCVRDLFVDSPINDLDLATDMLPEQMLDYGIENGFKVIPTGLAYGTVSFIFDKINIQVTTLRRDIKTFGRHASVEFSNSWSIDSDRRDFSFNALYLDQFGEVYDYHNGLADLEKHEIHFIGDCSKRIQEDYLRILRYFRFWGKYSSGYEDNLTLEEIKKNIAGIDLLSGERIRDELFKILDLNNAHIVIDYMFFIFQKLFRLEQNLLSSDIPLPFEEKFIILCCGFEDEISLTCFLNRLKIPNTLKRNVVYVFRFITKMDYIRDYLRSNSYNRELLLRIIKFVRIDIYQELIDKKLDKSQTFPISGRDLLELVPLPCIKDALRNLKEIWLDSNGSLDRASLLEIFAAKYLQKK